MYMCKYIYAHIIRTHLEPEPLDTAPLPARLCKKDLVTITLACGPGVHIQTQPQKERERSYFWLWVR